MRVRHYFRTIKQHTIQNRLNIIIGVVILILLFGLLNFWFGMRVMSGIRAYVGGEGLWSKAQKEAVINLVRYTHTQDKTYYRQFLKNTEVQIGDKQARLEMDKPDPDMAVVRDGFIQGGNHPDDVDDLYFLYQRFGDVSYMNQAVQIWAEGDSEIENLISVGERIHELMSTPFPVDDLQAQAARDHELSLLMNEVYEIDARLTVLENEFSAALGEGSRWVASTLLRTTVAITVILGLLSLIIALMSARSILRLDRQKSAFMSLAAHQLRTPITTINWSAESLRTQSSDDLSPAQKRYIKSLHQGAQRMSDLVGDLLRVSSLELGTYQSQEAEVNIRDAITETTRQYKPKITKKRLEVATDITPGTPTVRIDELGLKIILQNLVSNSVNYSRSGGRITINATLKKERLHILVADDGIGIPPTQSSQIFTKLFRADNARKHDPNEGTGLGLYITKAMTQYMDGKIWFDSAENSGTRMYVTLPVRKAHKLHLIRKGG